MRPVLFIAAALLTACAQMESQTSKVAVVESGFYRGEPYEIRTRVFNGPSGRFENTVVAYRGIATTCIPSSPRDCELKARRLIEEFYERRF